ncbi:uncharacterized protein EDB91DRAFT_1256069 [Suillus paluster]|uniref:uncharacterized protein n=1 Tax=Suillus paluster TaxID=48578 RepID=UPI001B8694F5|nr:uncharacterized protein EDB91DRAFT_1256069 [Suillus paluster]KAG1722450.1 hypothetical protein EDB91DRAFT_1256069 [Suillus paluster]
MDGAEGLESGADISIGAVGSDPTEHAPIRVVKEPLRAGNNHDYDAQVCRHLDCHDKVEHFDLALQMYVQKDHESDKDNEGGLAQHFVKDYFACACDLINGVHPQAPHPYQTFSTSINAYHLSYDPTLTKMTVDKAAENFSLPDLRPAVSDHLNQVDAHVDHFAVGKSSNTPAVVPETKTVATAKPQADTAVVQHDQVLGITHVITARPDGCYEQLIDALQQVWVEPVCFINVSAANHDVISSSQDECPCTMSAPQPFNPQ